MQLWMNHILTEYPINEKRIVLLNPYVSRRWLLKGKAHHTSGICATGFGPDVKAILPSPHSLVPGELLFSVFSEAILEDESNADVIGAFSKHCAHYIKKAKVAMSEEDKLRLAELAEEGGGEKVAKRTVKHVMPHIKSFSKSKQKCLATKAQLLDLWEWALEHNFIKSVYFEDGIKDYLSTVDPLPNVLIPFWEMGEESFHKDHPTKNLPSRDIGITVDDIDDGAKKKTAKKKAARTTSRSSKGKEVIVMTSSDDEESDSKSSSSDDSDDDCANQAGKRKTNVPVPGSTAKKARTVDQENNEEEDETSSSPIKPVVSRESTGTQDREGMTEAQAGKDGSQETKEQSGEDGNESVTSTSSDEEKEEASAVANRPSRIRTQPERLTYQQHTSHDKDNSIRREEEGKSNDEGKEEEIETKQDDMEEEEEEDPEEEETRSVEEDGSNKGGKEDEDGDGSGGGALGGDVTGNMGGGSDNGNDTKGGGNDKTDGGEPYTGGNDIANGGPSENCLVSNDKGVSVGSHLRITIRNNHSMQSWNTDSFYGHPGLLSKVSDVTNDSDDDESVRTPLVSMDLTDDESLGEMKSFFMNNPEAILGIGDVDSLIEEVA